MILRSFEVEKKYANNVIEFETDELTALCPFEFGGPDFYNLIIRYESTGETVESKSLKEYVESWRDVEISAEDLAMQIYKDVFHTCDPGKLYVRLEQARRGGIEETVEVGDRELNE